MADNDDLRDAVAALRIEVGRLASFALLLDDRLPHHCNGFMDRIEAVQDRLSAVDRDSTISGFPAVQAARVIRGLSSQGNALADQIVATQRQIRPLSKHVFYYPGELH